MATLKPLSCPNCGASQFERDPAGNLICLACGSQFASTREPIVCPSCNTENHPDALRCMHCGLSLGKVCTACNQLNPPGVDNCVHCGHPLDTLSAITTRFGEGKDRSKALRDKILISQKGQDGLFMQQQRERIDAEERARIARLIEQRTEARKQQRTLVITSLVAIGVVLVLVLIVTILLIRPR